MTITIGVKRRLVASFVAGMVLFGVPHVVSAATFVDEPGLASSEPDEPGMVRFRWRAVPQKHHFRIEMGAGLSSLVDDPEVRQGVGGGLYLGYQYGRWGGELSVFVGHNRYSGDLGQVGSTFLDAFIAGNISVSPTVELTQPTDRVRVHLDVGFGAYAVANAIRELVWTFGMSGGVSVTTQITKWFGVGVKLRYHLFNLGGDTLLDRSTLQTLDVLDRLEMPLFAALTF